MSGLKVALRMIGAVLLVGVSGPAMAENFGAIAYSQSSGANGYAVDYDGRRGAEERALEECGRGCRVVIWFKNACGALATGSGNAYGTGWASGRGQAEGIAMSECNARASNCGILRWACTSR